MKEKELATFSDETRTVLERLIRKGCIEIKENNNLQLSFKSKYAYNHSLFLRNQTK